MNLRAGTGGALFLSGHRGMEDKGGTIVRATATATVSTLSPLAAARGVEAGQMTWSSVPPLWPRLTMEGSQRRL